MAPGKHGGQPGINAVLPKMWSPGCQVVNLLNTSAQVIELGLPCKATDRISVCLVFQISKFVHVFYNKPQVDIV